MSVRERFESNPVVFGLALVVAGFTAGFAARAYVLPVEVATTNCTIDGLGYLEESHARDIAMLNEQLLRNESSAADRNIIPFDQEKYLAAANRIRGDIAESKKVYLAAIESLRRKCT
jgi:hypothetical protein